MAQFLNYLLIKKTAALSEQIHFQIDQKKIIL